MISHGRDYGLLVQQPAEAGHVECKMYSASASDMFAVSDGVGSLAAHLCFLDRLGCINHSMPRTKTSSSKPHSLLPHWSFIFPNTPYEILV